MSADAEGATPAVTPDAWYDETVAPALVSAAEECRRRGAPFLAVVGFGDIGGVVAWTPDECGLAFKALRLLATKCMTEDGGFNVDGFVFALMKRAQRDGHSSLILSQLGVPEKPEPKS